MSKKASSHQRRIWSPSPMSPPDTYTKVKSFVGLVGHYRHFIKGFARIAAPLYDLTSGENKDKKSERVTSRPKLLRLLNTSRRPVFRPPFWLFRTSINLSSLRRTRLVKASGLFFLKSRLMDATILLLMRVDIYDTEQRYHHNKQNSSPSSGQSQSNSMNTCRLMGK